MLAVKVQRSPELARGPRGTEAITADLGPPRNGQLACPGHRPGTQLHMAVTNGQTGFSDLELTHSLIPTALATSWPGATGQGEERHVPKRLLSHAFWAKAALPLPSAAV